ncbi:MAG: sigma-70 family RNA polymerase sigma factor [Bacteroidota bacterium]
MDYKNTHIDIVEGCRKGDRRSQFKLYKLYSKAMYNVCLRMVKNEVDAEDLLQSSFVDVFKRIHTFRAEASVGAWIKRIVINNCINFLKKRRLYFQELEDRHAQVAEIEVGESKVNVKAINEAIMQLSDGYRVVFSLYAMEGYDHKEIGQILNISEATSKSQYSRAKQKLKVLLDGKILRSKIK